MGAYKARDYNLVKYLLEMGASVSCRNNAGLTPILIATYLNPPRACRYISLVRLLIQHGANINDQYNDGGTLLHRIMDLSAIFWLNSYIHYELVDFYLEMGLSPGTKDRQGKTAMELAESFLNNNGTINPQACLMCSETLQKINSHPKYIK